MGVFDETQGPIYQRDTDGAFMGNSHSLSYWQYQLDADADRHEGFAGYPADTLRALSRTRSPPPRRARSPATRSTLAARPSSACWRSPSTTRPARACLSRTTLRRRGSLAPATMPSATVAA